MLPHFDNTEIAFQYKSDKDLRQARFLFSSMGSPFLTQLGMLVTKWSMRIGLPIKTIIKSTIFRQFCGGETLQEAAQTAAMLAKYNIGIILDYGVEGKEGEEAFDQAVPEFVKAIEYAASQPNIPFVSVKITGFARFALLELVHNGAALSEFEKSEWQRVQQRIDTICASASAQNIKVLIDAEETWIQKAVTHLANTMMEKYNQTRPIIFNTFQLYCHTSIAALYESYELANAKKFILGAKLVRGAYMEKERKRAAELKYPSPIQPDKQSTDRDYNEALLFCLQRISEIATFIGTHNEESCMLAAQYLEQYNIPHNHPFVHFSQLFGMSDNISFNLAHASYNVAKYLPYGPVQDVIPYLMRRAQENTSVAGQTGRELSLIHKELRRRKLN